MQTLPNIQNQLSTKDLFTAFKTQLAKDFEQCNLPADFVEVLEPDYAAILESIAGELRRNENKGHFNLMQLLYRIDISEAQLKRHLDKHPGENHYHLIAELIIKRVLQKVVIRQYYKNNESKSS